MASSLAIFAENRLHHYDNKTNPMNSSYAISEKCVPFVSLLNVVGRLQHLKDAVLIESS
jgi:hypothetical protein